MEKDQETEWTPSSYTYLKIAWRLFKQIGKILIKNVK